MRNRLHLGILRQGEKPRGILEVKAQTTVPRAISRESLRVIASWKLRQMTSHQGKRFQVVPLSTMTVLPRKHQRRLFPIDPTLDHFCARVRITIPMATHQRMREFRRKDSTEVLRTFCKKRQK